MQSTQNFMNILNENINFVEIISFLILIMRSFEIKQNLIL
jgi:hypothetical protein